MVFVNYFKGYEIVFTHFASKQFKQLNKRVAHKIHQKLTYIVAGIQGIAVKKLVSSVPRYRLRVDDYRVIFEVYKSRLIVLVVRIGHRRDVYDRGKK